MKQGTVTGGKHFIRESSCVVMLFLATFVTLSWLQIKLGSLRHFFCQSINEINIQQAARVIETIDLYNRTKLLPRKKRNTAILGLLGIITKWKFAKIIWWWRWKERSPKLSTTVMYLGYFKHDLKLCYVKLLTLA